MTVFNNDYKESSYWLDSAPPLTQSSLALPIHADVVIIGSGYTGLHTAIQTARAGRSTVILESGDIGFGCSVRNGGQVSTGIKPSYTKLKTKYGSDKAKAILREGDSALSWIESFVRTEKLDCDFERNGYFHAAHTPSHYEAMLKELKPIEDSGKQNPFPVTKSEQYSELGSDFYFGGVVFPNYAAIHAAKYHRGLVNLASNAGASLFGNCPALEIVRHSQTSKERFSVRTAQGLIKARDVMIATNGYTSQLTPWFHRRIIPIGSYIIATEPMDVARIDEMFPTQRIVSDSRKVVYYYRASPDRTRVLFGGRVSANETDCSKSGPRLHHQMCKIFPQLAKTKIDRSWMGTVGYTFDELPHTGIVNGMHYAMGFCGEGISMASYLGMRAGQKITENTSGETALDNLPFPTRPLYRGRPWFLPSAVSYYAWKDNWECKRAQRHHTA